MHTSPLATAGTGDGGGLNVYVRGLTASLATAGTEVTIFTRRNARDDPEMVEIEPGVTLIHVDAGPHGLTKADLGAHIDAFAAGVGSYLEVSQPEALHAHYWLSAAAAHQLKHTFDVPLGITFHTLGRVKAASGHPESDERTRSEQETMNCADVVFTSGPAEAAQLVRHYDVDEERIHHLTPGVDLTLFSPGQRSAAREAIGLDPNQAADPLLLFVGRLQPLKGAEIAIGALAQLSAPDARRARLVIVGGPSGPDGEATLRRLRQQARELGVAERVQFTNPRPHQQLASYYRAADVCVVPSRSESFGLVALEAAACATPVVTADVGGLRDNVVHKKTGLLVDGHDPACFAACIDELLTNPLWALELGEAARSRAASFTWTQSARAASGAFERAKNAELLVCV